MVQASFLTKEKSTKDCIIGILGNEWPLTIKKVHFGLKKYGISSTYQNTFKAVHQLLDEGILAVKDRKYQLNIEWLNQLKEFSDSVQSSYIQSLSTRFGILEEHGYMQLQFNKQIEMENFILDFIHEKIDGKSVICNWTFVWCPLFLSDKRKKMLRDITKKNGFYILSKQADYFSTWMGKNIWGKMGAKVKTGVNILGLDSMVVNDYIIQIFWPTGLQKSFVEYWDICAQEKELDMDSLHKLINEDNFFVNVMVMKNKKLAQEMRDDTLALFSKHPA